MMSRRIMPNLASLLLAFSLALVCDALFAQTSPCLNNKFDPNSPTTDCWSGPLVVCNDQNKDQCHGPGTGKPTPYNTGTMINPFTQVKNNRHFCYLSGTCVWIVDNPMMPYCDVQDGQNTSVNYPQELGC